MQTFTMVVILLAAATPILLAGISHSADNRAERFRHSGRVQFEASLDPARERYSEAPTGFDGRTNGFTPQGPDFDTLDEDNVEPLRSFNDNRFIFEEVELAADGLGPTYNAQSCSECHQNVVTGGASQIAEHRTGRLDVSGGFFESLGGSLIHSRATHQNIVERLAFEDDVRTYRISTNTLGTGFVECIANESFLALQAGQPSEMRGTAVMVPVLEANSEARIGRFGWKSQHASLVSFSADAYLNEMGITSPLFPDENTSAGRFVGYGSGYDKVADPEDDGVDIVAFANFTRSTKAPSRGRITRKVQSGPLWALRTRNRLMHDGLSFTKQEAIQRHTGQATAVRDDYNALSDEQRRLVLAFLDSL